ncbi:hypothetical protein DFH07DRAFT_28340 [Mycena maculata]|uniref:Uncharacterized protein n=1 Tax=Mycena maculata TaxID=230809 RepID=A0AAD7IK14_9AGAR|nr:hypothetical protein DFH07DRAFT_28340 [Mycena maculata]
MLVAQRVKICVEPLLYHGVLLGPSVPGLPRFTVDVVLSAIEKKPPGFLKYAVKHLFPAFDKQSDSGPQTASYLDAILEACTGITSLVAWSRLNDSLTTLASLDSFRRLTIDLREVFETNPRIVSPTPCSETSRISRS